MYLLAALVALTLPALAETGAGLPVVDCRATFPKLSLTLSGTDPALGLKQATCLLQIGRADKAAEALTSLLAASVPDPEVHHDLLVLQVVAEAALGRSEAAETALSGLKSRHGDTVGSLRARANLDARRGEHSAAWASVQKAMSRSSAAPHTRAAAAEVAALDAAHVPAPVRELLGGTLSTARYNTGVTARQAGRPADCVAALNPPRDSAEAKLLYNCTVEAGDLVNAPTALVAAGGIPGVAAAMVVSHARALQTAGRPDDAIALLTSGNLADPTASRDAATLLLNLYTTAGRLDDGMALVKQGKSSATARANFAVALVNAKRPADARAVLGTACPEMTGNNAVTCYQYLNGIPEAAGAPSAPAAAPTDPAAAPAAPAAPATPAVPAAPATPASPASPPG